MFNKEYTLRDWQRRFSSSLVEVKESLCYVVDFTSSDEGIFCSYFDNFSFGDKLNLEGCSKTINVNSPDFNLFPLLYLGWRNIKQLKGPIFLTRKVIRNWRQGLRLENYLIRSLDQPTPSIERILFTKNVISQYKDLKFEPLSKEKLLNFKEEDDGVALSKNFVISFNQKKLFFNDFCVGTFKDSSLILDTKFLFLKDELKRIKKEYGHNFEI